MKKLINIGTYILAISAFTALMVVNVQVGFNDAQSSEIINATVETQEAFAGPCSNRGCDDEPDYCDTYVVFEGLGIRIERDCTGEKGDDEPILED